MAEETIKKSARGGKREGAGRKKGVQIMENPKSENATFRVSKRTLEQIRQLRELTRHDDVPFNDMFVRWVDALASEYGL
jgi:ribosomal protein L19E